MCLVPLLACRIVAAVAAGIWVAGAASLGVFMLPVVLQRTEPVLCSSPRTLLASCKHGHCPHAGLEGGQGVVGLAIATLPDIRTLFFTVQTDHFSLLSL